MVIIKLISWIVIIFFGLIALYGFYLLHAPNSKFKDKVIPQPFRFIYNSVKDIPILNLELDRYERDLCLCFGSKFFGSLGVAIYSTLILSFSVVITLLIFNYIKIWYWCLICMFFSIAIPYLEITNHISRRARKLKIRNLDFYESAERYYNSGLQTPRTFENIADNATGPLKTVYNNFLSNYAVDRDVAYEEYVNTVNDKFSKEFIRCVIRYDTSGKVFKSNINTLVNNARTHYKLVDLSIEDKKIAKVMGIVVILAALVMAVSASNMSYANGAKPSGEFCTYLSAAIGLGVIFISELWEKIGGDV